MANETLSSDARADQYGAADSERSLTFGFTTGAVIGALGGLIGLGGAEFRLPLLISVFRFGRTRSSDRQ
jgi:uncharacterized membrane protein YfcA